MYRAIARNKRNTVFIILLFLVLIAVLAFAADQIWGGGSWGIFTGTLVGALIYVVIQYFASGSQAVALSGARPIEKRDDPRLYRIVENLSITEGLPMPKVYVVDDPAPNAFAAGRDPKHAVVAATTGLLDMMTDAELEGVMAHEMGHVKNYDIRVTTIVFGLVVAIGFIADMLMRMSFFGGNRNNNGGNPIVLILGIAAMILAPLAATMVQAAVSREREYLADATGAMTTRHPEALASALAKLAEYGRPMKRQNTSMAHMWLSDPTKPGIVDRMFSTHPPIEKRIARLRTIGSGF
ncbi:M48 family metalloprotease [Salinibacterium sp. dk2585]|uniref:M48 family metalloprotease n=1 Tax=unclassified Salinibacterium TaxID=2632331 RepID=UPI0011C25533|nr:MULTISPECIES: M48 family metalloprotease [unclassified Salinibacterium]QEE61937.1 M48 family metalloprotease [Salinibacterium sp. dk2585]TXK54508.1 M48 family metalloprotease [Salinibacterium sp. dk5596]